MNMSFTRLFLAAAHLAGMLFFRLFFQAITKFTKGSMRFIPNGSSPRVSWLAAFACGSILLTGCGLKATKPSAEDFSGFYSTKSRIVHEQEPGPPDVPAAMKRADAARHSGNRDEALYYYVKALELDGTNAAALARIGEIHAEKGNEDLAEVAYRMAVKVAPRNAAALEGLGLIQLQSRKHSEAGQSFTAAVAAESSRWRALNGLGLIADLHGDHGQAAEYFGKALRVEPGNPILLNNLGYSRYLAGDRQGALGYFDAALQADPRYSSAWLNKGLVYARERDDGAALDAFKHVVDEADAYNDLGYIYMMQGNPDAAHEYFERAISASPSYHQLAHENLKRLSAMN